MEVGFPELLLIVGLLLATAAALSGLFHGTALSISVLSVTAGVALALAGVVHTRPDDKNIVHVIELVLVFTIFSDGLVADRELVRRRWHPPGAGARRGDADHLRAHSPRRAPSVPGSGMVRGALLGAVLCATDPVVTSTVVASERVPPLVRHTLNLESGLNDGLALPLVLFFLVLATPGGEPGQAAVELCRRVARGLALVAFILVTLLWLTTSCGSPAP